MMNKISLPGGVYSILPIPHDIIDDEFGIDDIEFENDYRNWERNRMYPIRDTRRMSRADFMKHRLYFRLTRKPRKES